jgi:hypothetical protein
VRELTVNAELVEANRRLIETLKIVTDTLTRLTATLQKPQQETEYKPPPSEVQEAIKKLLQAKKPKGKNPATTPS